MTRLAYSWGTPRVKFGNLVSVGTCERHAVRLSLVKPHLSAAIRLAESLGLTVTVEKTPICVTGGRLDLMSTERDIGCWPRAFDDDGACRHCVVRPWCDGFDPEYAARFGFDGVEPLRTVSRQVFRRSRHDPEILKIHCVEIAIDQPDESALVELYELLQKVEARHGRLAVFPQRFIRDQWSPS